MLVPRRTFLATAAAAGASLVASASARPGLCAPPPAVPPAPADLEVRDFTVEGIGRRFVLLVPRHLAKGERAPLLILLHGLGETGDARMGAYAWLERYGLGTSYDRLLEAGAMRGLVLACPYMPNLPLADPGAFDAYANWIANAVVPQARSAAPM